jgi:hypothetical protein
MLYTTIDSMVRGLLLKERKPLHFYIEYLAHACSGLTRLNTTTLKNVNSKKIPVNSYKAVSIPCDYVDFIRVGFEVGENVRPLIQDNKLNRLNNYNSTGTKVVFENVTPDGLDVLSGIVEPYDYWYSKAGFDVSRTDWRYKIIPERNEIQLSAEFPYDYIVLDYITDGKEADAATRVDPLAVAALEKWVLWQVKLHNRTVSDGERREAERRFNDEWRLLRAAKSDLGTREDIVHAFRAGYSASYKN